MTTTWTTQIAEAREARNLAAATQVARDWQEDRKRFASLPGLTTPNGQEFSLLPLLDALHADDAPLCGLPTLHEFSLCGCND